MQEISDLQHAIEILEAQRALLGDAVVNTALAPMRDRLRDLQAPQGMEQRRLVTVLFADLVEFTTLTRRLDAEDVRELVNDYFARWTGAIERHGGVVEKFAGDAVMAVFGLVHSTDLDPIQSVRAALAMARELELLNRALEPRYGVRLQMRTGIHTGHAVVSTLRERRGQDFVIVGDSVNLAARLQALAPINGIVVSDATEQHVSREFELQPLPPAHVKGFEQPIACYAVLHARSHVALALDSAGAVAPLVGRDELLTKLQAGWRRLSAPTGQVPAPAQGQLFVIVSEPGLGKSRVLLEFERRLRREETPLHLLVGRSLPALRHVPYGLLRDLFAQQFNIQDSDAPEVVERKLEAGIQGVLPQQPDAAGLIGYLLGFSDSMGGAGRGEVHDPEVLRNQALARLDEYYTALAADRPLVALIEDLHSVDDSSLDLLDRLLATLGSRRILLVGTARPELAERRPQWRLAEGEQNSGSSPGSHSGRDLRADSRGRVTWLELPPLSAAECGRLLRELLRPLAVVPAQLEEQVTAAADGNPYFVEELVKVLIEDRVIDTLAQPWAVDEARLAQMRLPQTLTGVLQARLDSLQGETRTALQQAAVIGRVFWDQALVYLQGKERGPGGEWAGSMARGAPGAADVATVLRTLNEREMVFAHGVSSFERAQEFLFKHALLRDVAYGSVLKRTRRSYHRLAAQWLEEMTLRSRRSGEFAALIAGHYDAAGEGEQAAHWYLQAGRQASRTFANQEALRAFDRALALLPAAALPQRYAVLAERERVYDLLGWRTEQGSDLDQMEALVAALGDQAAAADTHLRRSRLALDQGEYAQATAAAQRAAARALDAPYLQAAALLQFGQVALRQGEYGQALALMQQAQTLAQAAGDRSLQADSLHGQAMAQVFLGELDAAQQSFEAALAEAIAAGNRRLECTLLNRLSWVPTSRNDFLLAARYADQALALSRAIGDRMTEANALTNLGNAYIQMSDFARGDGYSLEALALYRQLGDPAGEGAVLDNLGNSAWGSGNYVKALEYKQAALEIIQRIEDRHTETNILGNLGIVAGDMGDTSAAYTYLQRALALARADGNRSIESTVTMHLAMICLQRGAAEEALAYARTAFAVAEELDAPRDRINALNAWGSAHLALGDAAAALDLHRQEERLAEATGLADYAAGAIARQALALLALGDLRGATDRVEAVLATLPRLEDSTIYAPAEIYLACSRVLLAVGDGRAGEVLERAHSWLQAHLDRLGDEEHRRAFIDNIPAHAALMQAWQERQISTAS